MALRSEDGGLGIEDRLRLVAVTPPGLSRELLEPRVRAAVSGGATAVMVRFPGLSERALVERGRIAAALAGELGFFFILNGPTGAAAAAGAHAVHLGVRTEGPGEARRILDRLGKGGTTAIGYSLHRPFEEARGVLSHCDYVTYSPVFATPSKKGARPLGVAEFLRAARSLPLPVVALGGIGPGEAALLARAGCRMVAALSAVLGREDPRAAAAALREALEAGGRRSPGGKRAREGRGE